MQKNFDAIFIGAGQSGPSLAARFAERGMNVALIEREHLGGTCVNDGCIPTKTLVASARAAHHRNLIANATAKRHGARRRLSSARRAFGSRCSSLRSPSPLA